MPEPIRTKQMKKRCLPLEDWPAIDRRAWKAGHRSGGLLDDDGVAAKWAAATSSMIARGYGRFLSYVAASEDLESFASPKERVSRARVEAYIAHLRKYNCSNTVAARMRELGRAMSVMEPVTDWAWLRRIVARLRRSATPARDDRVRLLPAKTLFDLAANLMERAETTTSLPGWRRALLFRDGLMIATLCAWAPRARTIAATMIDTNLERRGEVWWMAFGPQETKNHRLVEIPLPAALTSRLERYLDHYRPLLTGRARGRLAGGAFWISSGGRPLTAKMVGQRVSAVTKRELGQALNPHLFRKIIPTELALHDPAHIGAAQPLLGHATYRTTEQAYNLGRAIDAARRLHHTIRSIRGSSQGTTS
jgi:integrase/recombinase XerD